jgi:hypothetical protein
LIWHVSFLCSGELVSGIAMLTSFQCGKGKIRGIVVKITTEYSKKAKGRVIASTSLDTKLLVPDAEVVVVTVLTNMAGEELAKCLITWKISAKESKKVN